jgi:hypothetical protein
MVDVALLLAVAAGLTGYAPEVDPRVGEKVSAGRRR